MSVTVRVGGWNSFLGNDPLSRNDFVIQTALEYLVAEYSSGFVSKNGSSAGYGLPSSSDNGGFIANSFLNMWNKYVERAINVAEQQADELNMVRVDFNINKSAFVEEAAARLGAARVAAGKPLTYAGQGTARFASLNREMEEVSQRAHLAADRLTAALEAKGYKFGNSDVPSGTRRRRS